MNRRRGFVLVAVLLAILLMAGLGLLIHEQVVATVETSRQVTLELQALSLAQNGIRVGRRLWAAMDAARLLEGPDGRIDCPGMRDPADFEAARRLDPENWQAPCDDGFALESLRRFQPMPAGGFFAFRFSNDPDEELPGEDRNGVLVVRSLGLMPDRRCGRPGCANHLSLVEATLRKEYAFDVLSAFTPAGASLNVEWPQGEAPIRTPTPWFSLLGSGSNGMAAVLHEVLETSENQPAKPDPVVDANPLYRDDPNRSRIFQAGYWSALDEGLRNLEPPSFETPIADGLYYLPDGGVLAGRYSGVLLARGDLVLHAGSEFRGLLIHLGTGRLTVRSGADLKGAVWMSNFSEGPDGPREGPLDLHVEAAVTIHYDRETLDRALGLLPPTLLGWRIVFPEMR
jgi:hypothetical protein